MRGPDDFAAEVLAAFVLTKLREITGDDILIANAAGDLGMVDVANPFAAPRLNLTPRLVAVRAAIFVTPEVAEEGVAAGIYRWPGPIVERMARQHAAHGEGIFNEMEIPDADRTVCVMAQVQ